MSLSTIEYAPILLLLIISTLLSIIIFFLSFFVVFQRPDNEKISAYECGFDPFDDARGKFDIRFYLVAILFIIFDLEVSFLFPWSLILGKITFFGFFIMVIFLVILTVGFIYEWKKGALEWE
jgi:NADH-quinone oxidoreductase subunit A